MGPMGYPAALVGHATSRCSNRRASRCRSRSTANSLWRTGARTFFNDQRAGRVGDILTVLITVNDSAKTQNTTNTSLTSQQRAGRAELLRAGVEPRQDPARRASIPPR